MKYYDYPAEKFASARQALLPPYPKGEIEAIDRAFMDCRVGLHRMNRAKLDDTVRLWIYTLECFMNAEGFSDADGESAWTRKLKSLTDADKQEISRLVTDLGNWFASQEV